MSEEGNRDDASVTLQYLNLRSNLLNCLSSMRLEYHKICEYIPDRNMPDNIIDKDMNFLADRKAYLLDIAKQGLSPDDYAYFKDLVDSFEIGYWRKRGLQKKVTKTY